MPALSLPRRHYGPAVLIFRWAGRRKSEPLNFRSRSEHAPINGRPATTPFCSNLNARSIYKLSPPPKVQTERNLQNSRLNPDEAGSLVDLECRIPAKCAFFTQLIRESQKLKTGWRRGWDSNPRAASAAAGFQDRCLQPLGHPSSLY